MYQEKGLIDSGDIAKVFGVLIAIVISQKVYPGLISYPITNDTWCKLVSRVVIAKLLKLPWKLLESYLKENSTNDNPYAIFLFLSIIPALGTCMSLFLFADLVSKKLGVIPESEKKEHDNEEEEEKGKLLK